MKQSGLRWAVRDQIARRGGFKGAKLFPAPEIDGFTTSLREADHLKDASKREPPSSNHNTGGYLPGPSAFSVDPHVSDLPKVVCPSLPPGFCSPSSTLVLDSGADALSSSASIP